MVTKLEKSIETKKRAVGIAVLSALLYAFYPPVAKILLHHCPPIILVALLYLGTGIGMLIIFPIISWFSPKKHHEQSIQKSDGLTLVGVIVANIIAGILMNLGIEYSSAASASLLGNFEVVATTLLAAALFHEPVSRKLWLAVGVVFVASCLLSIRNFEKFTISWGAILVILATFCWGMENNFTKVLSKRDPLQVVIVKGLGVGVGSLLISVLSHENWPSLKTILIAGLLGFVSFGLSIFFYILAQRYIGAAKTSAYYAIAPFLSVILAIVFLGETITFQFIIALSLMIIGSYLVTVAN